MADIAFVFHWSYSELADMSFAELEYWQQQAIERLPKP